MTRISTGLVAIDAGETIVNGWVGDDDVALSEITAPASSTLVIEGIANFIKQRISTTSFELVLPHAGAGGADLACAISALTSSETSTGTLNGRVATAIQQLNVLDANGRGLFYNLIGVTGDGDPGPGNAAFNNVNPTLVTEIYLDLLDANEGGRDVSGLIDLWAAGTIVIVRSLATANYAAYRLSGPPVVVAGRRKLIVSAVPNAAVGLLAAEPIAIEWRLAGADKDADAEVSDMAGRAVFDAELTGFRVLVRNIGDGRAARYGKLSAVSADWSAPAYVTGPVGPIATMTVDTTTTLAPGSAATFALTAVTGGYEIDIGIPAGRGQVSKGTYNPATAYVLDDAVLDNGSTWIALGPTTGNAPPVLPTTSNAFWQLLARKGTDGTGTGDMVGPASSVDGRFAAADGTSGKLLKYLTTAQATAALNAMVGDTGLGGTKGSVPAPAAGDAAANKFLKADGTWQTAGDVSLDQTLDFYSTLALEHAEDRLSGPVMAGPDGNGVFDGFNTLDFIDVVSALNLDTGTAGELRMVQSPFTTSAVTPSSTPGDYSTFTMGSLEWKLTNGYTTTKLGHFSNTARTINLKILKRNSAGNFTVVYAENFSHPGTGWADLTIATPYAVPSSGDYYVAGKYASGNVTTSAPAQARFFFTGDASGTQTFTEGIGERPAYRATQVTASSGFEVKGDVISTAPTAPTWARFYVFIKPNGAVINTDLVLSVTRNNAAYAPVTLTAAYTRADGSICYKSGKVSLTSLTSGTDGRWKLTASAANAAAVKALGILLGV